MIPAERAHLNVAAATHPGVKGKPNEDRYSVYAYRFSLDDRAPSVLALLADGIGGHRGGEIAAELAVNDIRNYVVRSASGYPTQILMQAFTHANQAIINYAKKDLSLAGMGTTCVCAWVIGDQLFASSVGDSRLYLQRSAALIRLTTDHTWIQEALSQGSLTPDQAKDHPNAHIIRRFLGSLHAYTPDMRLRLSSFESDDQAEANQGLHLLPGDRLLLCTDGLTDLVKDVEILDVLRTQKLDICPTHLINLANARGGHDNITVIALEVPPPAAKTRPIQSRQGSAKIRTRTEPHSAASWLMLVLILVAIFMLGLLLIFYFVR